jgi:hypothetical protein
MDKRIVELDVQLGKLRTKYKTVVSRIQLRCKHSKLYESMHTSGPTYRVCARCGLCETGWGIGHKTLVGECIIISEQELFTKRRGLQLGEPEKYQLSGTNAVPAITLRQLFKKEGFL